MYEHMISSFDIDSVSELRTAMLDRPVWRSRVWERLWGKSLKKSEVIWNAWKDVLLNAFKVRKLGFVKSKKVWNQIKIWTLTSLEGAIFMEPEMAEARINACPWILAIAYRRYQLSISIFYFEVPGCAGRVTSASVVRCMYVHSAKKESKHFFKFRFFI